MSNLRRGASTLALLLLSALTAFAANTNLPVVSGGSVSWSGGVGFEQTQLIMQGPSGKMITKDLSAGRDASLSLSEFSADAVDGTYTWELRYVPKVSDDVKRALAVARSRNDDATIQRIQHANGLDQVLSESGVLTVSHGLFITPSYDEPTNKRIHSSASIRKTDATGVIKPNDVVNADDFIVQGSLCVGLDCVNNESFGFDTVRLKENNTRLKFDDTSTSAGFPNGDWQLTANDSASGGANKFSVEDITNGKVPFTLTATAPTNSLFVANSGKVGFGNNSPVLNLHITTTDTPAIRQEQTNGGGFTAQTWDIGANEANWFVRDVTGGSRLPFRIRPGAPTSSVDISADGDVGVGTASPNANTRFDLNDSTQFKARLALTGQEFFAASNTSTDGVALILGVNRTNNRQLWIGDTANMAQNGTNEVIRFIPQLGIIDATATDAVTAKPLLLSPNASVGIGTLAPASKLHVVGDVRVTSGSFIDDGVTLNAPDYVFEPDYKLMPIEEVSEYVKANKHLPKIPSAVNFKQEGINLSKLQMSLLEKVEELTLYTVSQNDQIKDLKSENQLLRDRLAAIEAKLSQQ